MPNLASFRPVVDAVRFVQLALGFTLLTSGITPAFATPPDELAPLALESATTPTLEDAIARIFPSNGHGVAGEMPRASGESEAPVVVVVADQELSSEIRDQIESRLEVALFKHKAAKVVLRGRLHLSLPANQRLSSSALFEVAANAGADEVVVVRTPFLASTGEVMVQRVTSNGRTVLSEVAHAPSLRIRVGSPGGGIRPAGGRGNGVDALSVMTPPRVNTNLRTKKIRPSVVAGISMTNADAFRAFRRQAVRLTQRRMHSGWGREASVVGFHSYAPNGKRLSRVELMEFIGDEDAAGQAEFSGSAWLWATSGATGIMAASIFVGMLGGTLLATLTGSITDPAQDVDTFAMIGLGTATGAVVGTVPAVLVGLFPTFTAQFSDDDAIEKVRQYNLKVADAVGFPRDEVPFAYLGY